MARVNNLSNFLNDVADAIRTKKETTEQIPAANFDSEILSIETGIDTSDATATADDITEGKTAYGPDGKMTGTIRNNVSYSSIFVDTDVNVWTGQVQKSPEDPTMTDVLEFSNQNLNESGQKCLYTSVELNAEFADVANVIGLTAEKLVKGNTILGVEGTAEAGSQINNQDKTITQNGQYTADSGYTGLGTVTVNVPSGSGDVKLFETVEAMQADPNPSEGDLAVVYREELTGVTEESEFDSCTFPNTVVLSEAFTGNIYGRFSNTGSSYFNGSANMSSSDFSFNGRGDSGEIRVQYTSQDGITYTRTDGGEELQEFGVTIKYEPMRPWNDVLGNFMKIDGEYFGGLYEYKSNEYVMTKNQLNATPDYVYKKTFYGKNGVEVGTLTQAVSNSFADISAEVYAKIQAQYNNIQPRILTDQDKDIDSDIRIIPSKTDGTPLLNTSNVTNMIYMFSNCSSLTIIPLLDTSNVTNMNSMFSNCSSLTIIPLLDTSNVTNMGYMFGRCSSLTTIPLLDTSNVTNMSDMFYNCTSLSDESLNNILVMCKNAAKITSNKTLKYIGLTEEQAQICTTLSNYQAFTNAGWTTGY